MPTVDELAERTASDLSWHAFVHKAAWWHRVEITKDASAFLFWPHLFFQKAPQLLGLLKSLKGRIKALPSDNPGHYLNKQAIVYAVAVLEAFLPEAYAAQVGLPMPGQSLNFFVKFISNNADPKHYQTGHKIIQDFDQTARHACFLAEMRHVIVHRGGQVDSKFLGKIVPLRDVCIWRTGEDFAQDFQDGAQVCVDVDKVVIPYLEHAVSFVENAAYRLKKDLQPRP